MKSIKELLADYYDEDYSAISNTELKQRLSYLTDKSIYTNLVLALEGKKWYNCTWNW